MTHARRLLFGLLLTIACDDADDPPEDEDHGDVPAAVEGCPDGETLVEIGQTRACTCDDGSASEQTCLSTGAFADCQCVGGGW